MTRDQASKRISIGDFDLEWPAGLGTFLFAGQPAALLPLNAMLGPFCSAIRDTLGPDSFGVLFESQGRAGAAAQTIVDSTAKPSFLEQVAALAQNAAAAGWGQIELLDYDPQRPAARFIVHNSLEGRYQRNQGVCWGSALLGGILAGCCSEHYGAFCIYEQTAFSARGDEFDAFQISPATAAQEAQYHARLEGIRSASKDQALRESEERWLYALEGAGDGVWDWDATTDTVFFSKQWKAMLGYAEDEITNTLAEWESRVHPDDIKRTLAELNRYLAGESEIYRSEHRLRCKDGSYKWILDRGKILSRTPDGQPMRIIGTHADISIRKQVEEDLRASEAKFASIFENSYDAIVILTESGFIDCNQRALEMFGYNREELLKRCPASVSPVLQPDGRDSWAAADQYLAIAMATGHADFAWRHRRANGSEFSAQVLLTAFDCAGQRIMQATVRDVTKQQMAEAELRASEERFRILFDNAADASFIHDDAGLIIDVNSTACRSLGFERDELIGTNVRELELGLTTEQIEQLLERIQREQHTIVEGLHRRKDGTTFPVEINLSSFEHAGRSLLFASVRDISDRIASQEQLRQERIFTDAVLDSVPGLLYLFTIDGQLVRWNKKFTDITGYSHHELREMNINQFFSSAEWEVVAAEIKTVFSSGRGEVESKLLTKNGQEIPFFLTGVRLTIENQQYFTGIGLDTTARTLAETRMLKEIEFSDSLINSLPGMFFMIDRDRRLIRWNSNLERILDCTPDQLAGRDILDYISEEYRAPLAVETAQVAQLGASSLEVLVTAQDNQLQPFLLSGVHFSQGGMDYIVGTGTDLTELKQAEQARFDMERQLQHSQKLESLGVLAGGIAHDFNNLLMAIIGNLDLALIDISPVSVARDYLDRAARATRRASDLTRQMLAYSGKGRFNLEGIDLAELVFENAHLLKASISKTANLDLNVAPGLSLIEGDPGQIQQVVMNLITNASEAIGDHVGVITISTGEQECDDAYLSRSRVDVKPAAGRYAYLDVADNGCGMDADTLTRLFDPFYTTKFTGRGLGMAAVLGIIRGHYGAIIVDSEPGHGSRIRVLFPVANIKRPEPQQDAPHPPKPKTAYTGVALIVDDEESVRNLCAAFIKRLGMETVVAEDGETALALFEQRLAEVRFVILDLNMPKLDGVSTFRAMKALRPEVQVILCSGYNEQEATQQFEGEGLAAFIQKPYALSDLQQKIDQIMLA